MEQKKEYETFRETQGIPEIYEELNRKTRNNKRKKRNSQKENIGEQQRHNQQAAKHRIEQSKLTTK